MVKATMKMRITGKGVLKKLLIKESVITGVLFVVSLSSMISWFSAFWLNCGDSIGYSLAEQAIFKCCYM